MAVNATKAYKLISYPHNLIAIINSIIKQDKYYFAYKIYAGDMSIKREKSRGNGPIKNFLFIYIIIL